MKKNIDHKTLKIHDPDLCKLCTLGSCCRWGTELDLFEVANIIKSNPDVPKPWFDYLGRDRRLPSGYKFTTRVRNRKCVFQDKEMRCRVYKVRPLYCVQFPLEHGKRAPDYHYLCHLPKRKKRNPRKS